MQISLISQAQVCLLSNSEINFCGNFGGYDLTNGVTLPFKFGTILKLIVGMKILQLKIVEML